MGLEGLVKAIGIEPDNSKKDTNNDTKKYNVRARYDEKFKGIGYLKGLLNITTNYKQKVEYLSEYYDKVYNLLEEGKYSLKDVESFTAELTEKWQGIFISAAINKIIKENDEIHLHTKIPLDFLFYKFSRGKGYVNKAGDYFGYGMLGGYLEAESVGDSAFEYMFGGEGKVKEAGHGFGYGRYHGSVLYLGKSRKKLKHRFLLNKR